MTDQKPKALQLADRLRNEYCDGMAFDAAKELRRLHAENEQLRAQMEAIGAGGVGPIMLAVAPQPPKQKPAIAVPAFNHVAQRKLDRLLAEGWVISGYSIIKQLPSSEMRHGFVTAGCLVGWWQQPQAADGLKYPLPDDLYDSKDWRAGSYSERVEWLRVMYEGAKGQIAELESRLAAAPSVVEQPQGEQAPVAWMYAVDGEDEPRLHFYEPLAANNVSRITPLYTRPQPPRQPLTDEQRRQIWRDSPFRGNGGQIDWFIEGTRAAEIAHGIGQEGSAA